MDKHDIIQLFIEEAVEHLSEASNRLMELEANPTDQEIIQVLFRSAHTLKGNSTTAHNTLQDFDTDEKVLLHIKNIGRLTHAFENLIMEVRDNGLILTPERIELLFEVESTLETLLSYVEQEVGEELDVEDLSERLLQSVKDEEYVESKTIDSKQELKETGAKNIYKLSVSYDDETFKHAYVSMVYVDIRDKYEPSEDGKLLIFTPTFDELMEGKDFSDIYFELSNVFPANEVKKFVESRLNVSNVEIVDKKEEYAKPVETAVKVADKVNKVIDEKKQSNVKKNLISNTNIRVDIKRIDEVLKHVSSLVILKNKLSTYSSILSAEDTKILKDVSEEISQTVDFLQDSVMKIRMTPLEQLFGRFPKDVRNIAKEYNKKINFEHFGGGTEIDKSLLDNLGNPLIHLIRNSVFHGLESEEERVKAGKDPVGKLTLSAKHEQGMVVITVEDDGRGLDVIKVVEKAIEKGIITEEKAKTLKDEEALQLIFASGLSTAEKVTNVAGRGVGMDAVRATIEEEMKGTVQLYSVAGKGMKTVIRLPLTLAIINAMRTKINGDDFAFPTSQVEEVVSCEVSELKYVANKEIYILRNEEVPVIRLREFFKLEKSVSEESFLNLVILKIGDNKIAVTVDEFIGQEDIVVKNIGKHLGNIPGISGCNILGDGSICLIVDVNTLFNKVD